ncbi:SusD/RagB family nutrient-binding outer membrane lipoprotein [Leeuwenhoekiella marinoflava]|uniref:SusD/RagB-like outer membrane lipoprotein n=2 Tax=Leeuwenhoekiella marinoflava TaxID=988 RepID=A0A4Q0PSE1_9FLAO|nr:SusD/RagB family nutrient-binding outer membrane lipoprotein [Leeuwenhoekiella marinoflava]RXG33232.1 SusD/RagB-like outer membrane lipoprotein [Leeuwenhoekiella marinoflava]SHE43646.1 Susd and RagB outer membrane lipoprotein [Leeuwenhoekiella marinoflava DSM 3653]
MKKNITPLLILLMILVASCDKDDFAELNSDPSSLSDPDLRFSMTKSIEQMYGNDYTVWFYNNFDYIYPWTQVTTPSSGGGNSEDVIEMGEVGTQNIYNSLIPNTRDIRARIDAMSETEQEARKALRAMTFPIQIQPAITITDLYGSMVYSEAGLAPYTTPALLTPKYDTQEELFDIWLEELDAAIEDLSATNQFEIGDQDLIYNGDYLKWAKFCNLLKLKIAARMINTNLSRALSIAEEVANSPAGYMNDVSDDFIYKRGINYRGTGNPMGAGAGSIDLIDFMAQNKDPRLKVLFDKNSFNGEVVQAFIDAEQDLPPYIEQYVVLDEAGDFEGWSGPGEPWVRYYGVPLSPDAVFKAENNIYFNQNINNRINKDGVEKVYASTSNFAERITRTGFSFTYPTKPGGRVIQRTDNFPPLQVILGTSAETNLYLAEFKLLGASLPNDAQDYFNKGVRDSALRLDMLAENNGFPYYEEDPVYTDTALSQAGATKLKEGEIDDLLNQPAYNLSSDGLEKVYIQQYINFAATPGDLWTTVRRSGIPKTASEYLPRDPFLAGGTPLTVPRRFTVRTPTEDNKNFENMSEAYTEQGFTTGSNIPQVLNTERIWFDKSNPNYGAGPKQ